tara:strand:- start:445 stop:1041 length:597 start_codon:yes stop_codon:yes gene_type:complete
MANLGPIIRNYNPKTHKKCIKCRAWKPREDWKDENGTLIKAGFGKHDTSSDGLQSICHKCKNVANTKSREKNVTARIRHHIATRCLTQLGKLAPPEFTQKLTDYLGYKIPTLVRALRKDLQEREGKDRKLRDALNEGYHVDHVKPLSLFEVIAEPHDLDGIHKGPYVDWDSFKECWAIKNLSAIPADENLAKGAKYDE